MNERLGSHDKGEDTSEMSREEKLAMIARARKLAPFKGQAVDEYGSFVTHFRHQDDEGGFTSIYSWPQRTYGTRKIIQ